MLLCSTWCLGSQGIENKGLFPSLGPLVAHIGAPKRRNPAEAGFREGRVECRRQLRNSWWQALQPSPIFEVAARTPSQFTGGAASTPSSVARMFAACFA